MQISGSLALFFHAMISKNVVLSQFLGLCPLMGASRQLSAACGLALATGLVLTLSTCLCRALSIYVLDVYHLQHLNIILYIVTIAMSVQLCELLVRQYVPILHRYLGIYLPLITTNCAVLGAVLLNEQHGEPLFTSTLLGLGAGCGFAMVLVILSGIRERLALADIPHAFQGAAIHMLCCGILALAFMGFDGVA